MFFLTFQNLLFSLLCECHSQQITAATRIPKLKFKKISVCVCFTFYSFKFVRKTHKFLGRFEKKKDLQQYIEGKFILLALK